MADNRGRIAPRRNGFTLIELLVVIAIIGMLMALLLPAVGAATEAARQLTCRNQVKQVTLASIGFENQEGRFPGYQEKVGGHSVSWAVMLMPLLEQQAVYNAQVSGGAGGSIIEFLICPSDPPLKLNDPNLSYICNAGRVELDGQIANRPKDGVFLDRICDAKPRVSMESFIDGKSYTLLISENIQATTWDTVTPQKYCSSFVWHDTSSPDEQRRINGDKNTMEEVDANLARPSSYHIGGVVCGFADGHVIFLQESTSYNEYKNLMTPHGDG